MTIDTTFRRHLINLVSRSVLVFPSTCILPHSHYISCVDFSSVIFSIWLFLHFNIIIFLYFHHSYDKNKKKAIIQTFFAFLFDWRSIKGQRSKKTNIITKDFFRSIPQNTRWIKLPVVLFSAVRFMKKMGMASNFFRK